MDFGLTWRSEETTLCRSSDKLRVIYMFALRLLIWFSVRGGFSGPSVVKLFQKGHLPLNPLLKDV